MDRVNEYRRVIKEILHQHTLVRYSHGDFEQIAICDEKNDNYFLLAIGWDKRRRVHAIVFHLRIRDGKIWVEADWTEYSVAQELLDTGISQDEIVLGFHSAEKRPFTEFAVG